MKQKQQFRGMGFLLAISVVILCITTWMQSSLLRGNMSHQEFMMAVENKTIQSAHIEQNPQTPTGNIYLTMTDGADKSMAVSDVLRFRICSGRTRLIMFLLMFRRKIM